MENKFGLIIRSIKGHDLKRAIQELVNTSPITMLTDFKLVMEHLRGNLKTDLVDLDRDLGAASWRTTNSENKHELKVVLV